VVSVQTVNVLKDPPRASSCTMHTLLSVLTDPSWHDDPCLCAQAFHCTQLWHYTHVACCSSKTSTDPTATCNFLQGDQICYELWTVDEDISWEGGTFFFTLAPIMESTGFSSTTPCHYSFRHQHSGSVRSRKWLTIKELSWSFCLPMIHSSQCGIVVTQ
jgi:hypothetical protein